MRSFLPGDFLYISILCRSAGFVPSLPSCMIISVSLFSLIQSWCWLDIFTSTSIFLIDSVYKLEGATCPTGFVAFASRDHHPLRPKEAGNCSHFPEYTLGHLITITAYLTFALVITTHPLISVSALFFTLARIYLSLPIFPFGVHVMRRFSWRFLKVRHPSLSLSSHTPAFVSCLMVQPRTHTHTYTRVYTHVQEIIRITPIR